MRSESVAAVCERYSHKMRTPLGVALGVITDLVDGYEVPPDALKDAKSALEKIRDMLNELRDLPKGTEGTHDG